MKRLSRWPELPYVALVATGVLIALWDVWTLQRALYYFDISEQSMPFRRFFAQANQRLDLFPLWTKSLLAGFPLFAEGEAGPLYPLHFVFFPFLPAWQAYNLTFVLEILIAALGSYAWLRAFSSRPAAAAAACVFALSGALIVHHIHMGMVAAVVLLPVQLALAEWLYRRPSATRVGVLAATIAAQHFAGAPQITAMTLMALALYSVLRPSSRPAPALRRCAQDLGLLAAAHVTGALLAAVQILPTLELAAHSIRASTISEAMATQSSFPPSMLLVHVLPEAYGSRAFGTSLNAPGAYWHEVFNFVGPAALVLGLASVLHRDRRRVAALWALLLLFGALALGRHAKLFVWLHALPVLDVFRVPARYAFVVNLALAGLCALGLDHLLHSRPRWRILLPLALLAGVLALFAFIYLRVPEIEARVVGRHATGLFARLLREDLRLHGAILLTAVALSALAAFSLKRVPALALGALLALDLVWVARGFVPTAPPAYWTHTPASVAAVRAHGAAGRTLTQHCAPAYLPDAYRKRDDAELVRAPARLNHNLPLYYGLDTAGGLSPIRLAAYTELFDLVRRRDAWERLGVRYLVTCTRLVPGADRRELVRTGDVRVWLLERALPRAFVVHEARAADPRRAMRAFVAARDPERAAFVAPADLRDLALEPCASPAEVRVLRDEDERTDYRVRAACAGLLVQLDTHYPGWSARVDGRPAPLINANGAFRAVAVPAGEHVVSLRYESRAFARGLALSALGLVLWLGLQLFSRVRRRFG